MEVANRLLEHIEQGTAPWQKPWEAGQILPPINAVTGKPYRGVNYQNLMTLSPDPSDSRWCTYKQAREQGWQVREGSSGIPIEVWKEYEHKRTPEEIETIRQESGKSIQDIEKTEKRLGVRYYSVFHASQIDGIPPLARPERGHGLEGRPDPRLDGMSEAMGIAVRRGGSKAFYRPGEDFVQMPRIEDFHTATGHDTTLLHELSHATGHPQRLNREFGKTFGDQKYAIEELRAEMSAAMTAAALGIGFDPGAQSVEEGRELDNSAAYLASWLKALPEKERKQTIVRAIQDAQGISDYLIERTPERQMEQELEGPTVSRGDYVRYLDEVGAEIEAVVLDPARAGETTRLRHIYRWPDGRPGMDGADHIMPTVLPERLMEHIPGAVQLGPDLDAIDSLSEAYKRTMGMDDARDRAAHAVLMAVEAACGQPEPAVAMLAANAQKPVLDPDLIAFLEMRNRVRQGEHLDFAGLSDPVANAEAFVERQGRTDPRRSAQWARDLQESPVAYGNAVGIGPATVSLVASQLDQGARRMERPQVGDLVRFEPYEPDVTSSPFSGRVIAALNTSGGDIRYHLRAEAGPDQGIEARVYGGNGQFREIDLQQAVGFDRNRAPEAENAPRVPDDVRPFLGTQQTAVTDELLRGEEKAFFSDKMRELQEILWQMPATYESDGLPDGERMVSLRYFGPNGAQWFIIEKDRGDPENEGPGFPDQTQAFGLADLGMGYPEMGYISIPEITRAGAELDYHFTPTTLLEIKREHYPDLLPEEQELEQPPVAMAGPREQALAAYQAFYDALPDRAEALIQRTMEDSTALAPADFAGYETMLREYQAGVDETFGVIREGEYRGSSRPEVELMQALPGESIYNMPEVKARFAQSLPIQDRIGETRRALESDFKHRLKEHGKALLDSGSLQDPKEIYLACLWKSGAVVRPDSEMADKFVQAVEDRNLEHVMRWIGTNSQNPGSEEAFSRLTGVRLGKTQKERVAQLQEWAGPDRVAAMKQAHAERREKREEERKVLGVTHAWGNLQSFRVRMGDDRIIDGQSYVAEKVAQGQDHVVSRKEGAVTAYYLLNPETRDLSGVRKPAFTQYAKEVLALDPEGDVRKAMERAGLSQHLPTVEKPPVEPSGVPAPASERETTDPFEAKRHTVVQALKSLGWEKRPGEPEGGDLLQKTFLVRKDPAKGGEYFRGKAEFETQADAHVRTNGIRVEFGDNPYFVTDPTAITVGRTAPAPEAVAERIDAQTKAQIAKAFEHLGVTAVVDGGTKSIPGKPEPSRDTASALHELSRALDALNGHTLPVTQKDGTQKTVAARDYLEAGLGRGMTATEDLGSAVRWYNPEHGTRFSRTITDEKLAAALKQAAAVDRNVGKAIHAAQHSKVNELDFE